MNILLIKKLLNQLFLGHRINTLAIILLKA